MPPLSSPSHPSQRMRLLALPWRCTPVVTFTIPGSGVNWVSLNGETDIDVPNGDDRSYAHAIDTLLGDDELRDRCGKNGRKRVKALFTVPKMVEKMEECYREIEG